LSLGEVLALALELLNLFLLLLLLERALLLLALCLLLHLFALLLLECCELGPLTLLLLTFPAKLLLGLLDLEQMGWNLALLARVGCCGGLLLGLLLGSLLHGLFFRGSIILGGSSTARLLLGSLERRVSVCRCSSATSRSLIMTLPSPTCSFFRAFS
jgi:hypothetical protein